MHDVRLFTNTNKKLSLLIWYECVAVSGMSENENVYEFIFLANEYFNIIRYQRVTYHILYPARNPGYITESLVFQRLLPKPLIRGVFFGPDHL